MRPGQARAGVGVRFGWGATRRRVGDSGCSPAPVLGLQRPWLTAWLARCCPRRADREEGDGAPLATAWRATVGGLPRERDGRLHLPKTMEGLVWRCSSAPVEPWVPIPCQPGRLVPLLLRSSSSTPLPLGRMKVCGAKSTPKGRSGGSHRPECSGTVPGDRLFSTDADGTSH